MDFASAGRAIFLAAAMCTAELTFALTQDDGDYYSSGPSHLQHATLYSMSRFEDIANFPELRKVLQRVAFHYQNICGPTCR